jgi:hypothetical protein
MKKKKKKKCFGTERILFDCKRNNEIASVAE